MHAAALEQVVLEVLQRRVSIGSPVYERGHIVILGWLENQRDEEVLWKLLTQVWAGVSSGMFFFSKMNPCSMGAWSACSEGAVKFFQDAVACV